MGRPHLAESANGFLSHDHIPLRGLILLVDSNDSRQPLGRLAHSESKMNGSEASDANANSNLRQPKKRFVGRRTADAQAQKDGSQKDVESTSVQKGKP